MVKCFDRHCRPRIPNNYNSLSYVLSDREDLCDFMRECRLQLLPKKKKQVMYVSAMFPIFKPYGVIKKAFYCLHL